MLGKWGKAAREAQAFFKELPESRKNCLDAEQPYYFSLLATAKEDQLPESPWLMHRWGRNSYDFINDLIILPVHIAARKKIVPQFLKQLLEEKKKPEKAMAFEKNEINAIFQCLLLLGDYEKLWFWIKDPKVLDAIYPWAIGYLKLIIQTGSKQAYEKLREMLLDKTRDKLKIHKRIKNTKLYCYFENSLFKEAAQLLQNDPEIFTEEENAIVLAVFLFKTGYYQSKTETELREIASQKLCGTLKHLVEIFWGDSPLEINELWPSPRFLVYYRFWLCLFCREIGQKEKMREIVQSCIDPCYGQLHYQNQFREMLATSQSG